MASPDKPVLDRLIEVGDSLLNYVSSVDQLLNLLDQLENLLSSLDQAPDVTVTEALLPSMKALVSNELFRHSDDGVRISVASCIAEITRITAPEAPYDDDQMREIFKLTVAALEKLSHASGRCYEKAVLMVDNVARVRSCLLMMDLECDDLIIEMFQHFLRVIRSNHPYFVTFAMETIMTMVLNESEEISSDLLRPLLDSVRKENQTISPISWSLGEKVFINCADKLQPYLMRVVQSTGRALDAYAEIVVSICERGSETLQCDHSNVSGTPLVQADENKLAICKDVDEQPCDVTMGLEPDMTCVRDAAQTMDDPKPNKRNANSDQDKTGIVKKKASKRQPHSDLTKNDKRISTNPKSETGNSGSVGEPNSEAELDTVPRKRGRKPNSLMNPEEGYDHSWICTDKKSEKSVQSKKARNSGCGFPPSESPASRRDKLLQEPENVGEVSQPKTEKTIKSAQSRKAHDNGNGLLPLKIPASQKDKLLLEPKNVGELSQPKTKKITKTAQSTKTCDSGIELSPSKNPALQKDKLLSKTENMTEGSEALGSQPKTDEKTDAACPSTNHSDTSHRKRGRPRKNSITDNQGVGPKTVTMRKEDRLIAQVKDNSSEPTSLRLEKDSEVIEDTEVKAQAPHRKSKLAAKKTAMATGSIVGESESKSSNEDEKPKSVMNIKVENIEDDRSLTKTIVKKRRRLDATPHEDHNDSSTAKLMTESATKTLTGVEETPQTRQRRKGAAVSEEASEMRDGNEPLVGSRIKVWWPFDKRFYEGVVHSYDSVKGKYKILYVDGDVEVLNLKKQRWELITDHVSADTEQGKQPEAAAASDTAEKRKGNCKPESDEDVNADSRRNRSRSSARISKSIPAKSAGKSEDDSEVNDQNSAGKSKTRKLKIGSDKKDIKPEADSKQKSKLRKA